MSSKPLLLPSHSAVDLYVSSFEERASNNVRNVECVVGKVELSKTVALPTTLNSTEYENSYVCSPYTALIPYCKEELSKVDSVVVQKCVSCLLFIFDVVLKGFKINKVYQLNNWLLSTNLYPRGLTQGEIQLSVDMAREWNPDHILMYRSLNSHTNKSLLTYFSNIGFCLIPTRQVYIFDKSITDYSKKHNYKIDKKLLNKTKYKHVSESDIRESDIPRIIELYNALYIEKYSVHNPQFTTSFIEMVISHPNFYIEGFRSDDGVLDAVGGRFELDGVVTLPIVGYDTAKDPSLGLYRLVMMSALVYAEENNLVFNASSGASGFKSLRGAVPFIEYSAIYLNHLPFNRRLIWRWLKSILEYSFVPILKRYKL